MKEFLIKNLEFRMVGTMFFAGEVIIYTVIAPFIGQESLPLSLVWQMFIIAILLTFLQYSIYCSRVLENINVAIKLIIHYISLLLLGYGSAKLFNWFDVNNIKNLVISISIVSVSFIAFSMSVALYHKFTGEEFNEKLRLYKSSKIK